MSDVERKKLPFSSGEPGDLHYCQRIPEHPVWTALGSALVHPMLEIKEVSKDISKLISF
ncbi:MAG: hypothetical protein HN523_09545, partial [Porticoccaceae bacterium]|nr:hypothetical protein [Porticoccaceae bacterium]